MVKSYISGKVTMNSITPHSDAVTGIHHVTAISGNIGANLLFYTGVLGMRLIKKSINQDDVKAYHLFYADAVGSPGTDLTFFDWPNIGPMIEGKGIISNTRLRARGADALDWWERFLKAEGLRCEREKGTGNLRFADPEGQSLILIDDSELPGNALPWQSHVPTEYALRGIAGVDLISARPDATQSVLESVLGLEAKEDATGRYYETNSLSGIAQIRLVEAQDSSASGSGRAGIGGTHHVAFRVRDDAHLLTMQRRLEAAGLRTSGYVDRYYFHSLYFREPGGVLFELATDGPGMCIDEAEETLGEQVSIPPFLAGQRASIEAGLRPLPSPAYKHHASESNK